MLRWLDSVTSDSHCPNSPLIDFNGEILILSWPRSASKGQIICWGNAGHSMSWSQSIILTGCTKEKRRREEERKSNLVKLQWIHPQSGFTDLQGREREREYRYLWHRLQLIWIPMMCLLNGDAQQITADGITVRVPWAGNEDLGERVYILFKELLAWGGRETRVMCCVTTQWLFPPAGAITDLLMGSHQSQSASYFSSVFSLFSSVRGSWNRGNNGVLWFSSCSCSSTSLTHISSQNNALLCQHVY